MVFIREKSSKMIFEFFARFPDDVFIAGKREENKISSLTGAKITFFFEMGTLLSVFNGKNRRSLHRLLEKSFCKEYGSVCYATCFTQSYFVVISCLCVTILSVLRKIAIFTLSDKEKYSCYIELDT